MEFLTCYKIRQSFHIGNAWLAWTSATEVNAWPRLKELLGEKERLITAAETAVIIVTGCCVWPAPQMNEVKRMNNWPLRNETLCVGFNPSVFRNPSDSKSPDSSIRASASMAGPTSLAESKMVTGKTPSTLDSLVHLRLRKWPRERAEGREQRTCLTVNSPPPKL